MTSPFSLQRRTRRGFTLIELLVVISIIAILAGLLLPVISSVMQNAHKTEAKSTEQQIVAAVKNYYTEYGQYPIEVPANTTTPTDATFDTNAASMSNGLYGHNSLLFNVLRATNTAPTGNSNTDAAYVALNSRQIVYFESKDVKNTSTARSGFIPVSPSPSPQGNPKVGSVGLLVGDLVDPWGNLYYVRIDGNYTNAVMNPYNSGTSDTGTTINYTATSDTSSTTPAQLIRMDVIAWSPGLDGKMGTGGTNIQPSTITSCDDVVSWQ